MRNARVDSFSSFGTLPHPPARLAKINIEVVEPKHAVAVGDGNIADAVQVDVETDKASHREGGRAGAEGQLAP